MARKNLGGGESGGKGRRREGHTENGVENFTSSKTSQIELNNKNCSFSNEAKMFELSLEKDFLSVEKL